MIRASWYSTQPKGISKQVINCFDHEIDVKNNPLSSLSMEIHQKGGWKNWTFGMSFHALRFHHLSSLHTSVQVVILKPSDCLARKLVHYYSPLTFHRSSQRFDFGSTHFTKKKLATLGQRVTKIWTVSPYSTAKVEVKARKHYIEIGRILSLSSFKIVTLQVLSETKLQVRYIEVYYQVLPLINLRERVMMTLMP